MSEWQKEKKDEKIDLLQHSDANFLNDATKRSLY